MHYRGIKGENMKKINQKTFIINIKTVQGIIPQNIRFILSQYREKQKRVSGTRSHLNIVRTRRKKKSKIKLFWRGINKKRKQRSTRNRNKEKTDYKKQK